MVVLTSDVVYSRLQDVKNPTQEAIETMSMWIMHYKDNASIDLIVDGWLNCFKTAGTDNKRIALFYVMNDVVQKAKMKHADTLIPAFQPAVLTAVGIGRKQDKVKAVMKRCIQIFKSRNVFSPASTTAMENLLASDADEGYEAEDQALEVDSDDLVKKITNFISARNVVADMMKCVNEGNFADAKPQEMSADAEKKNRSMRIILLIFFLIRATLTLEYLGHADPEVVQAEQDIPIHRPREYKKRRLEDGDELLLSQVVWRHGDRAPTGTYPTDPHKEEAWPNGWGELTQLGMRQQYALGRLLYKKYVNSTGPSKLLSSSYNSKEVYIRSTDVNRTLVSALANLAGMFENGNRGADYPDSKRWPTNWTPIPIHTLAEKDDPVGNVFAPCARAEELTRQIYAGSGFQKFVAENQEFLDFVSEKSGKKVIMPEIYMVNDVHFIEKLYNMSQPEWITDDVEIKLRNLSQVSTRFLFGIGDPYIPELIRLRGGPLLRAMMDKMNQKLSCLAKNNEGEDCSWIGKLKYHAYSAHDTTVYAFLTTFGDEERVIEGGMPHYTASVAVELWNLKNGGPSVRVLFHSAFHHNYHVITHLAKGCPHNSEFCPLKTFEQRSLKFLPVNLQKECAPKKSAEKNRTLWKIRDN